MKWQVFLIGIILGIVCVSCTEKVEASSVMVKSVPIAQHFFSSDRSRGGGRHDCIAASLAMALNTLYKENGLMVSRDRITYDAIRSSLREEVPNTDQGIPPQVLLDTTPTLTDEEYS